MQIEFFLRVAGCNDIPVSEKVLAEVWTGLRKEAEENGNRGAVPRFPGAFEAVVVASREGRSYWREGSSEVLLLSFASDQAGLWAKASKG